MRTKITIRRTDDRTDHTVDNGSRRASGRARKLTAKAVALNGSRSYSPPIEDTIVIGETSPKRRHSSNNKSSPVPSSPKNDSEETQVLQQIPETPAKPQENGIRTSSPEVMVQDEAPAPVFETTASRRHSLREKKPTAKVLSEPATTHKRPSTDDFEEAPARKSTRLSYSGARVPSKLRYSVSSDSSEFQPENEAEKPQAPETPAVTKSKIIILKLKQQSDKFALPTQPKANSHSTLDKGKPKRGPGRPRKTPKEAANKPESRPRPEDLTGSCNLSCLSPSSRLLAFAQIALQMPDDEEEDVDVVPGGVHDWRMYTQTWCQCDQGQQTRTNSTDSVELARALMPNTVAQGTRSDLVDVATPHKPESELLSTPVNTILRASDAERLSKLYGPATLGASLSPNGLPPRGAKRPADDISAPLYGRPPLKRVISESPDRYSSLQSTPSYPTRRTYEDRLRDDYNALADIRKRAAARGIPWSYNQTIEDLQALLTQAENREQQNQYRQQVINPPTVLGRAHEAASEPRPSPTGFGVLLPPKGSTFIQRNANGPPQRNGSPATTTSTNGSSVPSSEPSRPSRISFVEETDPVNAGKARRPSSPSRPKSSRFRVDPRGLRGQAPGPGTIINMEDLKKKAEGLKRLGKAMRDYEAKRKIMEDKRNEEYRLRMEKWERDKAEKRAMEEAAAANGNGEA
ncbi:hypothetical protein H2200_009108 [Cladophialophora chaetospira]|uniref:Uncharacterized protein n=1 Tax=Cladophialophora chaetospira TaxID=386627 RepID=A0AA38X3J5_9EURO|nr:hypothetical protein H2200_009108 [Cladophialophora chaetospira]